MCPKVLFITWEGGTLNKTSPFKTYLNFRNGLSLLVKNMPINELVWKLWIRLILDGLAALKLMISSSPQHLTAVLKAHFHFYGRFRLNWRNRSRLSALRGGSIVWKYFIGGKKTFTDINQ